MFTIPHRSFRALWNLQLSSYEWGAFTNPRVSSCYIIYGLQNMYLTFMIIISTKCQKLYFNHRYSVCIRQEAGYCCIEYVVSQVVIRISYRQTLSNNSHTLRRNVINFEFSLRFAGTKHRMQLGVDFLPEMTKPLLIPRLKMTNYVQKTI